MKIADSIMAGKTSDSSIKWQLCYDMSARTWWMGSWPRESKPENLITPALLCSLKRGPLFSILSSRSEDQTDSAHNLGQLPQQGCLYPELMYENRSRDIHYIELQALGQWKPEE
ncbi:Mucin-19 [Manis pentadactyla]|nr:Mucin-19 [Manis pentadactyla]